MTAVSTNYGATDPRAAKGSNVYGSSGGNRKGSNYVLNSMGSGGGKEKRSSNTTNSSMFHMAKRAVHRMSSDPFRSDGSKNETTTTYERMHDSNSIGSNDSRKMIIKKEIHIRVEHDGEGARGGELGIRPDMGGRAL